MFTKDKASFRDPCGAVYISNDKIIRTINNDYRNDWDFFKSSGLLESLISNKAIINFKECSDIPDNYNRDILYKCIEVEKIPFISYPYEWSFPQLKDAALHTLEIQKIAMLKGMTLKDASAYNIQFHYGKPVLIDLLSFEVLQENQPWQAYRQFCMHFLAPLALQSYDYRLTRLSSTWIDGIPLDLAWKMLPAKAFMNGGLQLHLHLHSVAERKYEDGNVALKNQHKKTLTKNQFIELIDSLIRTIKALAIPKELGEWAEYYENTNYSENSEKDKITFVANTSKNYSAKLALDLGANTGKYSEIIAEDFEHVISADIDSTAVSMNYLNLKKKNILPLVQDLANPSPAIGFGCFERKSFIERTNVDMCLALALTHHLFFSARIAWHEQAIFFSSILNQNACLLIEFVKREDSQVQHMLSTRDDIFADYTIDDFRNSFANFFIEKEMYPVIDTDRVLFVLEKK